jgi:hypothetical protein
LFGETKEDDSQFRTERMGLSLPELLPEPLGQLVDERERLQVVGTLNATVTKRRDVYVRR